MGSEQKQPQEFDPGFASDGQGIVAAAGSHLAVMKHEIRVSLLPRFLYLVLLWGIGLGAAGSVAFGAVSLAEERKLDEAIAQLARNARALLQRVGVPPPDAPIAVIPPIAAIPFPPSITKLPMPAKRHAATEGPDPKKVPSRAARMREALQRYRQLRAAEAGAVRSHGPP